MAGESGVDAVSALIDSDIEDVMDDINQTDTERAGKAPKYKYMRFVPEALKYVSINHKFAQSNPGKYTGYGVKYNMSFKMLKSDSRLIKSILFSYGFIHCSKRNTHVNLIWSNTHLPGSTLRTLHHWQRLNHFPRSVSITKKDLLHQNISIMKKAFPEAYAFFPESYILPDELSLLRKTIDSKKTEFPPMISKPAASSRGRGITIVKNANELFSLEHDPRSKLLLSRYISNPYLVNGRKFDLRIYVTVISFQPLIVYMFNEGLARFAVEEYNDDVSTMSETYKHLTNYSLNKNSGDFVKNMDATKEDIGHKWTLSALLRKLADDGVDTKLLMVRIEDIVIKTLLSIQFQVAGACRSTGLGPNVCFELFGFDVLIDEHLKPWLLEVNLSPSLACDAPLDAVLKTRVVCDTLNLAMIPLYRGTNSSNIPVGDEENAGQDQVDQDAQSTTSGVSSGSRSNSPVGKTIGMKKPRMGKTFRATDKFTNISPSSRVRSLLHRLNCEKTRKGNFVRIFPRKETYGLYKPIIEQCDMRNECIDDMMYRMLFEEEPEFCESLKEITDVHKELMDANNYPQSENLSSSALSFFQSALVEVEAYESEKHIDGKKLYPKLLPRLQTTFRRRTASQMDIDDAKRRVRLESIVQPLSQLGYGDISNAKIESIAKEKKRKAFDQV